MERWFGLTLAGALLMLLWRYLPHLEALLLPHDPAAPRVVITRGNLVADEKATIELFEKARDSVVFSTTRAQVRDFWTPARRGSRAGRSTTPAAPPPRGRSCGRHRR